MHYIFGSQSFGVRSCNMMCIRSCSCSCNIQDHFGNKKGIKSWCSIPFSEIGNFFLESDKPSNSTCIYYSNSINIYIVFINTSVLYPLITGYNSSLSKTIQLAGFLSVQEISRLKVFDFASKPGLELSCIELCNEISATYTISKIIPIFCYRIPQWCYSTHSGYN